MRCPAALPTAIIVLLSATMARAAGVVEDAAGESGFFCSPRMTALNSSVTIVDHERNDGTIYLVSAVLPYGDRTFVAIDQAYIVSSGDDIRSDFGDLRLRGRVLISQKDGHRWSLVGAVRAGNGNSTLFPFSSQSLDIELGIGYVDTLEVMHVWGIAQVASVNRAPVTGSDDTDHSDFVRVNGGLTVPMARRVALRMGASFLAYRTGAQREVYFAQCRFEQSAPVGLFLGAQLEAGKAVQRASDRSVSAGMSVRF